MIVAKVIIVVCLSLALFFIQKPMRSWALHFFKPKHITYSLPHIFEESYLQELQALLKNTIEEERAESISVLIKKFQFFSNIHAWRIPHKQMVHVMAEAHNPLLIINNSYILFDNNTLHPITFFKPWVYKDLEHITISAFDNHEIVSLSPQDFTALQSIPFSLLQEFNIVWNDATDIIAYSKKPSVLALRFNTINGISLQTMDHYYVLLQEYTHKAAKKKSARWIADVRFEKQIVVYQDTQKRGNYGAHIG